jgi:hypothetical protein
MLVSGSAMRNATRRRSWLIGLLAIATLVVVGFPLGLRALAEQEHASREWERLAAETRWQQAGYQNYTVSIEVGHCLSIAHVRGDLAAIDAQLPSCSSQPVSIQALFDLLGRDGSVERLCDTRGCPCESILNTRGSYNAEHGYPERVTMTTDLQPAWLSADLWRGMLADLALPPCNSREVRQIRVVGIVKES